MPQPYPVLTRSAAGCVSPRCQPLRSRAGPPARPVICHRVPSAARKASCWGAASTSSELDGRLVVGHTLVAPSEAGASADTPLSVMLEQAAGLKRGGEYQQAIAIYRLVLDSRNAPDVELSAYVLSQISDVNIERGTYPEAVTASNEAITLLRQAHKEHTGLFARAERILSEALYAGGYDQEARNTATEALALARQTLDTRSLEFTRFLTSLGQIVK
jgi:tetratricopeptide (TPR) repeat protein